MLLAGNCVCCCWLRLLLAGNCFCCLWLANVFVGWLIAAGKSLRRSLLERAGGIGSGKHRGYIRTSHRARGCERGQRLRERAEGTGGQELGFTGAQFVCGFCSFISAFVARLACAASASARPAASARCTSAASQTWILSSKKRADPRGPPRFRLCPQARLALRIVGLLTCGLRVFRPCLRFRGGHQRLRLRGMSLVCEGLGAVCDGLGVEGRRMGCPGEDCHSHRRLFATKSPSSYVSGQPLRGTMHDMPMHERVPAQ